MQGVADMQVEPGKIWCFEQEQALAGINVVTTIRMTVVKLRNGDLMVYAPIAPTRYLHQTQNDTASLSDRTACHFLRITLCMLITCKRSFVCAVLQLLGIYTYFAHQM